MRGGGCPSWETSIIAPCLPQLPSVLLTTQKIHQTPFTFVKTSISLCAQGLTDFSHDSHLTISSILDQFSRILVSRLESVEVETLAAKQESLKT